MYDLYTSAGVFHSVAFGLIVSLMVICYFKAWLGAAGDVPKNWVNAACPATFSRARTPHTRVKRAHIYCMPCLALQEPNEGMIDPLAVDRKLRFCR